MAIARVQTAFATGGSVSSLNALMSSLAVTSANTLIVHYNGGGFGSPPAFTPTDNVNSGAYSTAIASTINDGANGGCGICYKLNLSSGGIASTYRVSFAAFGSAGFVSMNLLEYSGIASFDNANVSTGVISSSPTTPVVTAANANSLWSAVGAPYSGSTLTARSTGLPTVMTPLIIDQNNNNQLMISGELLTSSLALTTPITFRVSASTRWMAQVAIFAPTVASGAGPRNPEAFNLLGCV